MNISETHMLFGLGLITGASVALMACTFYTSQVESEEDKERNRQIEFVRKTLVGFLEGQKTLHTARIELSNAEKNLERAVDRLYSIKRADDPEKKKARAEVVRARQQHAELQDFYNSTKERFSENMSTWTIPPKV
jgi:hypothetical protein